MAKTLTRSGTVGLGGEHIHFILRQVPRRRHVRLSFGDDAALEVRAPYRFTLGEAKEAISENAAWVLRGLGHARERAARRETLTSGIRLRLLDEILELAVRRAARTRVVRAGALLHVECPHPSPELTAQLLEKWYRRRANAYLPRRVFELAAELNVLPSRVTIRGQRSRWGSCSASAAISLNWRLMMLDAELTHYVLVHELCHLRHLNHSPAFWEMVHSVVPDARRQRRRLRDAPTEFRF